MAVGPAEVRPRRLGTLGSAPKRLMGGDIDPPCSAAAAAAEEDAAAAAAGGVLAASSALSFSCLYMLLRKVVWGGRGGACARVLMGGGNAARQCCLQVWRTMLGRTCACACVAAHTHGHDPQRHSIWNGRPWNASASGHVPLLQLSQARLDCAVLHAPSPPSSAARRRQRCHRRHAAPVVPVARVVPYAFPSVEVEVIHVAGRRLAGLPAVRQGRLQPLPGNPEELLH